MLTPLADVGPSSSSQQPRSVAVHAEHRPTGSGLSSATVHADAEPEQDAGCKRPLVLPTVATIQAGMSELFTPRSLRMTKKPHVAGSFFPDDDAGAAHTVVATPAAPAVTGAVPVKAVAGTFPVAGLQPRAWRGRRRGLSCVTPHSPLR